MSQYALFGLCWGVRDVHPTYRLSSGAWMITNDFGSPYRSLRGGRPA